MKRIIEFYLNKVREQSKFRSNLSEALGFDVDDVPGQLETKDLWSLLEIPAERILYIKHDDYLIELEVDYEDEKDVISNYSDGTKEVIKCEDIPDEYLKRIKQHLNKEHDKWIQKYLD